MHETSIVILHFGNIQDTIECIRSLRKNNTDDSLHTIIVSNSQNDGINSAIARINPSIEVILNRCNLGFAEGNNIGMRRAMELGSKYIILLNNDVFLSDSLIKNLVGCSKHHPQADLISPKIYFAKNYEYHKGRYRNNEKGKVFWYAGGRIDWDNCYASHNGVDEADEGQYDRFIKTDFATGCCMLIKRKVIEKTGFFDKKYFLYYEDVDYSLRAAKSGFGVYYCPDVYLWHKNASSSGKPGSSTHLYYQTRNRLYFGYKYAPIRTKKSLLWESLRKFIKGGVEGRAIKDYYLGKMWKGSL